RAVLAAAEQEGIDGASALLGIAAGVETICRLSLVVPKAVHKAGVHPPRVVGAVAAAAGVGAALGREARRLVDGLGVAGSMASGIIEYLAEGSWTKRMHPGWAAQSGLRAALLGRAGFSGPRTVFEGTHGLFAAFARATEGNYAALLDCLGQRLLMTGSAFKPYPCGTMIQPYVDCARRLRKRAGREGIVELVAEVAEGTVHRLWEPLADKQRPPNGYAGKFSAPYCIAATLVRGNLGFYAFTDDAVADPAVRALAAKVRYQIDAANPYPFEYTGHLRARLADGRLIEERQPHLRGGGREPLTRADLEEKLRSNARAGGVLALPLSADVYDVPVGQRLAGAVADRLGRIHVLVNNAAVRPDKPFESLSLADWRAVHSVILDGAFLTVKAALPHLKASGS